MTTIDVTTVLPLLYAVYERHSTGCCAHIVTDDDNTRDRDVDFCLKQAYEAKHADCIALCEALRKMSRTQRHKLYKVRASPLFLFRNCYGG